jgi:hypothetical protein
LGFVPNLAALSGRDPLSISQGAMTYQLRRLRLHGLMPGLAAALSNRDFRRRCRLGSQRLEIITPPGILAGILNSRSVGATDPDDVPPLPVNPVTRAGDLWHLGRHRLLCGDTTERADVEFLLAGAEPHSMVTDPQARRRYPIEVPAPGGCLTATGREEFELRC